MKIAPSKYKLLQLDHWCAQQTPDFQKQLKDSGIKACYVPENCTELAQVIDLGPGKDIKGFMKNLFKKDFCSPGRTEKWSNGEIPMREIRILMTQWLGEAWDHYCKYKKEYNTTKFKQAGFFNDILGRENNLVKVPGCKDYTVPLKQE